MEIPTELLHDILLKLSTKDVARSSCVSRLWCDILTVTDPSFHALHSKANNVATPLQRDVEALLVSQHQEEHGGCVAAAVVFRVSRPAKPMCRVANPKGYRLANVCNGLLCFASLADGEAPAVICNPVSGEKLELPRAPPPETPDQLRRRHHFALGFSPSTDEYKLFRLSFSTTNNEDGYVHVYTLGSAGWRQHPRILQHCPMYGLPPVLIDGRLCMLTHKPNQPNRRPDRVLVMDVASETYRTYRLPNYMEGLPVNVRVNTFELQGRLSVAMNILDWDHPELQVWLLPPWDMLQTTKDDEMYWDRRYSFRLDNAASSSSQEIDLYRPRRCSDNLQRAAWLDGGETLCYRLGDRLYKYDTTRYMPASNFGSLPWNQEPQPCLRPPSMPSEEFNFYGGYRPTLLSPLVFALTAPSQVEEGNEQELEEKTTILCVPNCHKSKRHSSPVDRTRTDGRATKRICCSSIDRPCRCYLARLYKLH